MKSPCWSAGTRPNGCRCRCTGRDIFSSVSWKRYSTLRAVRMRPAPLKKGLRGEPNRVTSDICFLLRARSRKVGTGFWNHHAPTIKGERDDDSEESHPARCLFHLHAVGLDGRDRGRACQKVDEGAHRR